MIDILEPFKGKMTVVMCVDHLRQIMVDIFYSQDQTPFESDENQMKINNEDAGVFDVIGEITNMIIGGFMKKITPEEQKISVSLPLSGRGLQKGKEGVQSFFIQEQKPFSVSVNLAESQYS